MLKRRKLLLTVCGMKDPENIRRVAQLNPDFMGFIFYPPSPRFAGDLRKNDLEMLDAHISKVGVFVDPSEKAVREKYELLELDYVQLHGTESTDFVKDLAEKDIRIIKVISGNNELDSGYMEKVEPYIDYWLMDNRPELPGGTGIKFDRSVLNTYPFEKPVLLSGGLDAEEVLQIRQEAHPAVAGVDVNSKVEDAPGIKNIGRIEILLNSLE
ncbi:MAG: phosphoribosylanthranilate isomerase [Cyclobacteriaceae bacterium]